MPPRSVCLNVFTSSLGNGKEAVETVREVTTDKGTFEDGKILESRENVRRDSTQTSPNGSIVSPTRTHIATTGINIATFAHHVGASRPMAPLACDVCSSRGSSSARLSRCSRCKSRYYCSKSCQRLDWKSHKPECGPAGANSAQSTPNVSTPASPIHEYCGN